MSRNELQSYSVLTITIFDFSLSFNCRLCGRIRHPSTSTCPGLKKDFVHDLSVRLGARGPKGKVQFRVRDPRVLRALLEFTSDIEWLKFSNYLFELRYFHYNFFDDEVLTNGPTAEMKHVLYLFFNCWNQREIRPFELQLKEMKSGHLLCLAAVPQVLN